MSELRGRGFYYVFYHLSHSVIWWTSHIGPHDTVTVRVFDSTGGRSNNKILFSNCTNMSRNRYISDVLDGKNTPISMNFSVTPKGVITAVLVRVVNLL